MTNNKSTGRTKETDGTIDVDEARLREAEREAKDKAEKISRKIVESQLPPGTRLPEDMDVSIPKKKRR